MARQKVQDKEKAILDAAITVFAERGFWDTPTSLISKTAGIADGTLFTYFKTKDDLINEVYLEIKREIADLLMKGINDYTTTHGKMRHVWNYYIAWGVRNPIKFNVITQIGTSYPLSDEVKVQAMEPFAEIERTAKASIAQGEIQDYPVEYLAALMDSQSVLTVRFISALGSSDADLAKYQQIGFDILWNGVVAR
ncbi:MAG: TetR/AcrR family transcriptional regulator [Anaerolineae bacterium]|nr:TetR/AcrR family transcriptional regulator [Anaerolineae bacterium]